METNKKIKITKTFLNNKKNAQGISTVILDTNMITCNYGHRPFFFLRSHKYTLKIRQHLQQMVMDNLDGCM